MMWPFIFMAIVLIHGLIHLMGFARAYGYGNMKQLTLEISKPAGSIWLFACILFLVVFAGLIFRKDWWAVIAIFAVLISQIVIIISWKDAKFGTIANIIIVINAIMWWSTQHSK